MNPYAVVSSGIGTSEASTLGARLSAWHDAMVAHERRLRTSGSTDSCHEECPHVEARTLWAEALDTFGARAHELTFLRSRGREGSRDSQSATPCPRTAVPSGPARTAAEGVAP